MSALDTPITRRTAVQGIAGLVIGVYLPRELFAESGASLSAAPFAPNAFVRIGTDNIVTVLIKHIEFGQGPFTGLSTLVAEELDAAWSQIRAVHAPANAALYKNLIFGMQATGGSSAIANSYEQMRSAGATARAMLVAAAAQTWKVPANEITVDRGVLRHARTKRQGRFGQFTAAAAQLPVPTDVKLKDPSQFRLIGNDKHLLRKLDVVGKTNGTAKFTMDIRERGMLTVVVARAPRFGARVSSFDATAARAVRGVVDVRQISTGVAVYAEGVWPAMKARDLLRVTWDESGVERRSTAQLETEYRALTRQPGNVAGTRGDVDAALARANKVIEAEFVFPYLAHAPMEPLDGFLRWDGQRAVARFGSQFQTGEHATIAKVLGLTLDNVEIETMLAGGSFGRRAQPTMHLAAELAEVAKVIGPNRPVKLVWTREDDIRGGYYRPLVVHRMRGAVQDGRVVALASTTVSQSIMKGTAFEGMIQNGVDPTSVEGLADHPYDIPDFRSDVHTTDVGVPVLWFRSVGHTHTAYAVECFIDELLQAAGQDPVAGRLAMMGKAPREAATLRAVADLAKWSGPGPVNGRARGVAVVKSFNSYVAQIAEVSLEGGLPRVHKVWCAVDCGVAVNPDIIRAQMEGGIGFGLGHAMFAEITLADGRPVQRNFDGYRSLRIHEMPEVEVTIVASSEKPTGVGEPGVPPVAPAVANAMGRLGVERPRHLPMVRGRS